MVYFQHQTPLNSPSIKGPGDGSLSVFPGYITRGQSNSSLAARVAPAHSHAGAWPAVRVDTFLVFKLCTGGSSIFDMAAGSYPAWLSLCGTCRSTRSLASSPTRQGCGRWWCMAVPPSSTSCARSSVGASHVVTHRDVAFANSGLI